MHAPTCSTGGSLAPQLDAGDGGQAPHLDQGVRDLAPHHDRVAWPSILLLRVAAWPHTLLQGVVAWPRTLPHGQCTDAMLQAPTHVPNNAMHRQHSLHAYPQHKETAPSIPRVPQH